METNKKKCCASKATASKPGAAVDVADNEKVTRKEVDERTDILDENPPSEPLFNETDTPAPL